MNRAELLELIRNDENSGVEFKRDDIDARKLAPEIVALLNLEGGHILLGVEKDGSVSGLNRQPSRAEEWVMQVARDHILPGCEPLLGSVGAVAGEERWCHLSASERSGQAIQSKARLRMGDQDPGGDDHQGCHSRGGKAGSTNSRDNFGMA